MNKKSQNKEGFRIAEKIYFTDDMIDYASATWLGLPFEDKVALASDMIGLNENASDSFYPAGTIDYKNDMGLGTSIESRDRSWEEAASLRGMQALPPFSNANKVIMHLSEKTQSSTSKTHYDGSELEVRVTRKDEFSTLIWDIDETLVDYVRNKNGGMIIETYNLQTIGTILEHMDFVMKGGRLVMLSRTKAELRQYSLFRISEQYGHPIIAKKLEQGPIPSAYCHAIDAFSNQPEKPPIDPQEMFHKLNVSSGYAARRMNMGIAIPFMDNSMQHHPDNIALAFLLHKYGNKVYAAMPESKLGASNTALRAKGMPSFGLSEYSLLEKVNLPKYLPENVYI